MKLLVSRCLLGHRVAWHGKVSSAAAAFEERLIACTKQHHPLLQVIPLCPEVDLLQLPVPRPPLKLIAGKLVFANGEDDDDNDNKSMTFDDDARLSEFLRSIGIHQLSEIAGFVCKAKSPSCALLDAVEFDATGKEKVSRSSRGLFTEALLAKIPELPVASEKQLGTEVAVSEFVARCARERLSV